MSGVIKTKKDYTKRKQSNLPKLLPETDIPILLRNAQEYQNRKSALKGNYIYLSMALQLYAGLRISEVIKIRPIDITFNPGDDEDDLRVVSSKSHEERLIPIPDNELSSLLRYINSDSGIDPKVPYIRRSTKTLWQLYKKIYERSGIEYHGTHQLRHTYAKRMLNAGISLYELQMLLGHKDFNSTKEYLKVVPNRTDIKNAFKRLRIINKNMVEEQKWKKVFLNKKYIIWH